jgi:hypothetical protein
LTFTYGSRRYRSRDPFPFPIYLISTFQLFSVEGQNPPLWNLAAYCCSYCCSFSGSCLLRACACLAAAANQTPHPAFLFFSILLGFRVRHLLIRKGAVASKGRRFVPGQGHTNFLLKAQSFPELQKPTSSRRVNSSTPGVFYFKSNALDQLLATRVETRNNSSRFDSAF